MGTLLKVGEIDVTTVRNMVTTPVPYSSGQVSVSYFADNPNPGSTVSYLLSQTDGPTTRGYNQYLGDYARITTPLLGAGSETDPYYFYPYPLITRMRVNLTAAMRAEILDAPYFNVLQHIRAYAGVQARMRLAFYNAANTQLWVRTASSTTMSDSAWWTYYAAFGAPPPSVVNAATYVFFGLEVMSGMSPAQNFYDVTGFRATPAQNNDFDDWRGLYFDGSTVYPQANYVGSWVGTPRNSQSLLTITAISSTTAETEATEVLSMAEDVTGINASAISGGAAQARVTVPYDPDDPDVTGLGAEIIDDNLGQFYGRIRDITDAVSTEITVDESLALLNAWVTAPPMSGTLSSVLRNYVSLAQAKVRGFAFEDGLDVVPATVPGFVGNLYDKVRELLAAYGAEMLTINGTHVVRRPMQDKVILENFTESPSVSRGLQETSELVRVHWYDNEYMTDQQVYPIAPYASEIADDSVTEPTVYSVGAGEKLTVDIQLRASLLSVNTPNYVAFVPNQDVTGQGVYTAVGSDSLPITPAQWNAGGGKIEVKLSEDPSVVTVTITGPKFPNLAPFRLAMSSGSGNYYNALRITGTGVFVRDQYLDFATGALPSATGQKFAIECTNPYISTREQAFAAGHIVAGRQAQRQEMQFSLPTPNDPGVPVLGLLPGSKFVYRDQMYRVATTEVNHHTVSGTAEFALTASDFDYYFGSVSSLTAGEFDALYNGESVTALNFSLKPLRHRTTEA